MAVYFPREQQRLKTIQDKLMLDYAGVMKNKAYGLVFVSNQELTLAERDALEGAVSGPLELYHLERVTAVWISHASGRSDASLASRMMLTTALRLYRQAATATRT